MEGVDFEFMLLGSLVLTTQLSIQMWYPGLLCTIPATGMLLLLFSVGQTTRLPDP